MTVYLFKCYQLLIEVDHLQDVPSPYLQIKGLNKEAVAAAGSALKLDGSYTTKVSVSVKNLSCLTGAVYMLKLWTLFFVHRVICK